MYSLVYSSIAVKALGSAELEQMLKEFRARNNKLSITGALLYDGGIRFMQALEGPETHVKRLFNKISTDTRHHTVNVLSEGLINQRNFDSWSMHYKRFSANQSDSCDYFSLIFGDTPRIDSDSTVKLAQTFRSQFD